MRRMTGVGGHVRGAGYFRVNHSMNQIVNVQHQTKPNNTNKISSPIKVLKVPNNDPRDRVCFKDCQRKRGNTVHQMTRLLISVPRQKSWQRTKL